MNQNLGRLHLDVSRNKVGPEGGQALAESDLRKAKNILTLNLSGMGFKEGNDRNSNIKL